MKALKRMKVGKVSGYNTNAEERLGYSGKLLKKCWKGHRVSNNFCKTVIVPLYKGKGSRQVANLVIAIKLDVYCRIRFDGWRISTSQSNLAFPISRYGNSSAPDMMGLPETSPRRDSLAISIASGDTVQRTNLCRPELPANDKMRRYNAP
ncbi:hypothetical protein EVAR_44604_1 [Eumeta japonica]|uniref:Uncharacterized protein n=1 Tax=Eumeta variegata TaxID=151549 RepID=A0A4C1XCY6_EUMVA|nr:hypothetical protein EVAR_44604_1 [Eumeta japonica]